MPLKVLDSVNLSYALMDELGNQTYETRQKVATAIELAAYLHEEQRRGGTFPNKPYISHPLRNALRITRYGCDDPDVIIAAILHDTVEDQAAIMYEILYGEQPADEKSAKVGALALITDLFGSETTRIVDSVTNPTLPTDLTKQERNHAYLLHVTDVIQDPKVFLVKFSDWVDNAVGLYHTEGAEMVTRLASKYLPLVPVFTSAYAQHRDNLNVSKKGLIQIENHLRLGNKRLQALAA